MSKIDNYVSSVMKWLDGRDKKKVSKGEVNRFLRREYNPREVSYEDVQKVVNVLKDRDIIFHAEKSSYDVN